MKHSLGLIMTYTIVALLLLYAVIATNGSAAEIDSKITQLTSLSERQALKTNILDQDSIKKVETYKTFGQQPVTPNESNLDRSNPFEGI